MVWPGLLTGTPTAGMLAHPTHTIDFLEEDGMKVRSRIKLLTAISASALGLTLTAMPANAAAPTYVPPQPGSTTAFISGTSASLSWKANTVGWSRGTIAIHVILYHNYARSFEDTHTCYSTTYCEYRLSTFCPAAGIWTVDATGSGPGGSSHDTKSLTV